MMQFFFSMMEDTHTALYLFPVAVEGDGGRLRTARERHAPLQYWRGERPAIERLPGSATIEVVEWITKPKPPPESFQQRRNESAARRRSASAAAAASKMNRRGRSTSAKLELIDEEDEDVTDWDSQTEAGGMVLDYQTGQEHMRSEWHLRLSVGLFVSYRS